MEGPDRLVCHEVFIDELGIGGSSPESLNTFDDVPASTSAHATEVDPALDGVDLQELVNGHINEGEEQTFQDIVEIDVDELEDWVLVGNNDFEFLLEGEEDEVLKKLERIMRNIELRLERGSMVQVAISKIPIATAIVGLDARRTTCVHAS
jgi:hypothetical protein